MKRKIASGAEHQQAEQAPERALQDVERAEGFAHVDFGRQAEVVLVEPRPGGHRRARRGSRGGPRRRRRVLPAAAASTTAVSGISERRTLGRKPAVRSPPGSRTKHVENRLGARLVGQDAEQNQLIVEAAVGKHQPVLVEGVRFAGFVDAAQLQELREVAFGANAQAERRRSLGSFRRAPGR